MFQSKVRLLSPKLTTWKQRRDILASKIGLQFIKTITPPVINQFCLDKEQLVLLPASVYNKNLTTQSVTKQELPKYQPSQNPTSHIDSHKNMMNKKLFSKADSLIEKNLFCPRIKLSISQTLILDGIETGNSLLDFAQQLLRKNADIPDIYFTLLDAAGISPTLILNQNAKTKERGS